MFFFLQLANFAFHFVALGAGAFSLVFSLVSLVFHLLRHLGQLGNFVLRLTSSVLTVFMLRGQFCMLALQVGMLTPQPTDFFLELSNTGEVLLPGFPRLVTLCRLDMTVSDAVDLGRLGQS